MGLPALSAPVDTLAQMFSVVPEPGQGLDQLTFAALITYINILMMGAYAFVLSFESPNRMVTLAWAFSCLCSAALNAFCYVYANDYNMLPSTQLTNLVFNSVLGLIGL